MNKWEPWGLWLGGVLVGVAIGLFAADVRADTDTNPEPANAIAGAKHFCGKQSIQLSFNDLNISVSRHKVAQADPSTDPVVLELMRNQILLAQANVERLTLQCAIFQRLGYGA